VHLLWSLILSLQEESLEKTLSQIKEKYNISDLEVTPLEKAIAQL
jgi:hypothetical protein